MPRRRVAAKREILPDPKFGNIHLSEVYEPRNGQRQESQLLNGLSTVRLDIVEERLKEESRGSV